MFCGLNFVLQLPAAGNIEPVAEAFYRDHHAEPRRCELLDLKHRSEAWRFVTTEKHAINLGPAPFRAGSLSVIQVKMELADAANAVDTSSACMARNEKVEFGSAAVVAGASCHRGIPALLIMTKHPKEAERLKKIIEDFPNITVTVLGDLVADGFCIR